MILPKGTIIRLGQNESHTIVNIAVGIEFELNRDTAWGDEVFLAKVVRKPIGSKWSDQVTHRLDITADKVVYIPGVNNNRQATHILDKEY